MLDTDNNIVCIWCYGLVAAKANILTTSIGVSSEGLLATMVNYNESGHILSINVKATTAEAEEKTIIELNQEQDPSTSTA